MRRLICGAIAVALMCLLAGRAMADTVTYSTSGSFGGPDAILGGTALQIGGVGGATLTFAPASGGFTSFPISVLPGQTTVTLGTFTLTTANTSLLSLSAGDTFTVNIFQTPPGGPPGSSTAQVQGTVAIGSGGEVVFNFAPNPLLIGSDLYTFETHYDISTQTAVGTAVLNVHVQAVPLPSTAGVGLVLLGGMGGLGGLRRLNGRRSAVA